MISSDDIEVVRAYAKFLEDPKDKAPMLVNIGILDSDEKAEALSDGIISDNPYWYHFDSHIFAYVNTYLGETIEQYYSEETTLNDFILIREEELD